MNNHLSLPVEFPAFFPPYMLIESLDRGMVFVFGSNRKGIHGKGSAKTALYPFGAAYGVGEGMTGAAYALPTCEIPGRSLMLSDIENHVKNFRRHVEENPHVVFVVTAVGTGYAGYNHHDIAPMFKGIPRCIFPDNWKPYVM